MVFYNAYSSTSVARKLFPSRLYGQRSLQMNFMDLHRDNIIITIIIVFVGQNAHLCIIDYDINASLFGVFDGSGGPEVAFCAAEKIPELIKNDFYCNGDYGEALKKAFTDFDQFLLTGEGFKRMKLHHGPVPGRNKSKFIVF